MPSQRILVTGPLNEYAEQVLGEFGELVTTPDTSERTLIEWIDGAQALIVRGVAPISASVIHGSPDLRVIARSGVGYSNVDIEAATARGIPVVYTPGAGARAVAEASMAFMLALSKKVVYWNEQMKAGNWQSRFESEGGDLHEATVGIVGLGRIGQLVASMVRPFEMRVLAHDPVVTEETASSVGARLVDLDTLLAESDFICLHCAETPATKGMINRRRLANVKPGAFLINLARGGIVESLDVLFEAIEDGRLAGMALDVFEPEPPEIGHPIFQSDKCLTSPHALAASKGAMAKICKSMADDVAAILRGQRPRFVVNPEVLGEA